MVRWFRPPTLAWVLLLLGAVTVAADQAPSFNDARKAFEDGFVLGGSDPAARERLRAGKRDAVVALRECGDARAVALLLDGHKRQGRFVDGLSQDWARRREAHLKLAPAMEKALQARSAHAKDGQILVSPSEKAWLDEKTALEQLRTDIGEEEEIGEFIRKAVGRVLGGLEGAAHEQSLREILKAVGKGQTPEERDFIRLLGYVPGEAVTQSLLELAKDMQPLVAMSALEALGRQNSPRGVDLLLERLQDPRWQVRAAALEGLAFHRQARIVETLLTLGCKEDGVLKRHYLTALARIAGSGMEALPPTLEAWSAWWAQNQQGVIEQWAKAERTGPVQDELAPIALGRSGDGATSFYGIRTESKHIVFVVDVSGSMGEHGGVDEHGKMRIDIVKAELINAIRGLSADDEDERGPSSFNIVTYAADVGVFRDGKMVPATKSNKEKAFEWIQGLTANGATNIFDAVEKAFSIVDTRRLAKQLSQGADTIFLMTDGEPNRGKIVEPDLIRAEVQKMNRDRKITLHAIGVGKDHNKAFLERLASENQGEYLAR